MMPRWFQPGDDLSIALKVKRISVLTGRGTDKISIEVEDGFAAFPSMRYNTAINIDTEAGLGVKYVREVLGIQNPEVIELRHV